MKRLSIALFAFVGAAGIAHANVLPTKTLQQTGSTRLGTLSAQSPYAVRSIGPGNVFSGVGLELAGSLVPNANTTVAPTNWSAPSDLLSTGIDNDRSGLSPLAYIEQIVSPPNPNQYEYFSDPITIAGNTAFVGAPDAAGGGAVFAYTYANGVWTLVQTITANPPGGQFGIGIAIDGTTAVIGANIATVNGNVYQGQAFVFTYANGTWTQTAMLVADNGAASDVFGQTVALKGNTALVGAPQVNSVGNQYQGAAYIFTNTGGVWSQTAELTASDGQANDYFSHGLGLASETTAIVGCTSIHGAAWVFKNIGGNWTQTQKLTANDTPGGTPLFAYNLAVDGNTALFGAQVDGATSPAGYEGAAYVFTEPNGTWTQIQKLIADNGNNGDGFGRAVALSRSRALIGAWGDNGYTGSAYLFKAIDGVFTQATQFFASDGAANDYYGYDVAVSDTTSLVGAYAKVVNGMPYVGEAYFYSYIPTAGDPVASITPNSLDFHSVPADATRSTVLDIANTGGGTLTYVISETATACASPGDVPWLGESRSGGSVADGDSQSVTVTVDTAGLAVGDYAAKLCVTTNDPANALVEVPVSLTVHGPLVVCSAPINYTFASDQNGTYVNWATGEIANNVIADGYNFNAYGDSSLAFYWGDAGNAGVSATVGGLDWVVLQTGDAIGPGSIFSAAYGDAPTWEAGADGYLGFQFNCVAGTCFGYAHITSTAATGFPATLVDYCYDAGGSAITVGSADTNTIFQDGFDGTP